MATMFKERPEREDRSAKLDQIKKWANTNYNKARREKPMTDTDRLLDDYDKGKLDKRKVITKLKDMAYPDDDISEMLMPNGQKFN